MADEVSVKQSGWTYIYIYIHMLYIYVHIYNNIYMYIMCVCLAIFWGYDGDTVGICGDIYIFICILYIR